MTDSPNNGGYPYNPNEWARPTSQQNSAPSGPGTQGAQGAAGPYPPGGTPPANSYPSHSHAQPSHPHARPSRSQTKTRVWPAVVTASLASAALATAGTFAVLTTTPSVEPVTSSGATQVETISRVTSLETVVEEVSDTVVAIDVTTANGGGMGSGVIIDADGHILTNNHVVSGANDIRVTLADGRIYAASVVGTDPTTDLAVIALQDPPTDLAVATMGDSDGVKVGHDVVAVGNPLGLSSTVTTGIVSALDRPVTTVDQAAGDRVVTNAIQIDAAINPGNSGGPLFNSAGEVIGINSSIASTAERAGSIGLGFAIPSNLAQRVADEIIETGAATHAFLGVSMVDSSATTDGVTRAGAEIVDVVPDSASADAGLRSGDVIVSIDGRPVSGAESLTGYVRQYTPGTQVELSVARDAGLEQIAVTLGSA